MLAALATEERLASLREICLKHPGNVGVAMELVLPQSSEVTVAASGLKVAPSDELLGAIDKLFGEKVAEFA